MQYRLACPKLEPLGIRAGDWCSFPRWEGTIMMHRTFGLAVCAGALLALLSTVSGDAQAQSAVITGKVTGRGGEALGGATVLVEGLGISAGTAQSGTYTLTVPADKAKGQTVTLRARYIGYQAGTKQITLTPGTQTQDFELKFDPMTLDVVVVTGTAGGTELKKVPFAVSQVDRSQLQEAPAVSALGSLEGKVAGVRLIDASGAPGGESVRPKTIPVSLAHPYLVDTIGTYTDGAGNVVHNGDFIAANGDFIGPLDLPSIKPSGIADVPYTAYNRPVYDAQTALLTHGAFYTNYISIGQRRANTNYNVSFENTKQDGVLRILNGYNRQNFRLNVDQQLTPRMDLSVGGFFGKSTNNKVAEGPGAPFFAVTFIEPYINLFAPNPDGTPYAAVIPHQLPNAANPLYTLANEHLTTDRTRITGYAKATYRIFDWLSLEGNYNYDEESSSFTDETPKNFLNSSGAPTTGQLVKIDSGGRTFNTGVTLTSTRNLNLGGVRIRNTTKAAYIYEDQTARSLGDTGKAFTVVATPEFNAVDFSTLAPFSHNLTIRNKNYYVVSNFDINDRYILDGLVRWDGSSLFGSESRWQTYYRASGAYRLSQDFHINGIDEFKLRASYGTAGLRPSFSAQYETFANVGGKLTKVTLGNTALKPAHSGELELGANVDFLSRFSLDYSYSRKNTTHQIILMPLSAPAGYRYQWQNAESPLRKTHELSLRVILADRPELSWQFNGAADRTRQYITSLNPAPFLTGPSYDGSTDVTQIFRIAPGEAFGVMYGTRIVRSINELYDDPSKSPACPGTWCPDSLIVNEDGYVVRKSGYHTANEKFLTYVDKSWSPSVKIGDVNPDFNASFTSNVRFKSFTAYVLVDWVQGGSIYNGTRQWPFFEYRDRLYDQTNRAEVNCAGNLDPHCPYSTGKKPIAYYQGLYNGINPIDYFVESGTYVKIKELNVSYTIGHGTLEKLGWGVNSLRIGVIGRNLFTFTKYSGYDPEVAGLSGDPYSFRFDGFSYPNFRTFTGFMEINF